MAIRRNACSLLALPDFPEFAQAVRYGVPGTPPRYRLVGMQHQVLSSIFVHQGQPLEGTTAGCPVVNEVTGPNVVLEPGRLLDATLGADPRLGAEVPGFPLGIQPMIERAGRTKLVPPGPVVCVVRKSWQ